MDKNSRGGLPLPAILSARDLKVFRGGRCVCGNINLTVQAGERVEITGANGSGKTSLLRVFSGLSSNYTGELSWHGCVWEKRDRQEESQFIGSSYIGHKTGFKNDLSVWENLRFYGLMKVASDGNADNSDDNLDHKVEMALKCLGVARFANRPFSALSEGQRRRAVLARLAVEAASLWLLDEPASALDREGVTMLEKLLDAHVSRGGVAIIVTHRGLEGTGKVKRLVLSSNEKNRQKESYEEHEKC